MTLVILTEEDSMKAALGPLLKRLEVTDYEIIAFQGVSDLERSLPRRIRGWRDPNARFLVIRDNDDGDCHKRKERLLWLVAQAGGTRVVKVRIVMQQLEAWFLGDPLALEAAGFLKHGSRPASLQDPEHHAKPVDHLCRMDPGYGKITGAMRIAPHLDPARNTCRSFHTTIAAIREMAAANGV